MEWSDGAECDCILMIIKLINEALYKIPKL